MSSTDVFISKTLETNQRFQKTSATSRNVYSDIIAKAIKVCMVEAHSTTKIDALKLVLPAVEEVVQKDSPVCGYITYILADECRHARMFEEANRYGNDSLRIREILYGAESNEVCICLDLLATTAVEHESFEEATAYFVRSFGSKATGEYTTFVQLLADVNRFTQSITDRGGRPLPHVVAVLVAATDSLLALLDIARETERLADLKRAISTLCIDRSKIHTEALDYAASIPCYKTILTAMAAGHTSHPTLSKEERMSYELIIQCNFKLGRFDETKSYVLQFIAHATKCNGMLSAENANILWFCAKVMEEQSDRASPTRLCDLVDGLRYYLCIIRLSREVGGNTITLGEDTAIQAQKKVREKIETILFNNRPLKPEDVANMVERMISITNIDFLLNANKSQNWLLKYLYPEFMAEDALKEKLETLPSKTGFISKLNGLMKTWKNRWFTLEREVLSYYKYHNDPKPHGEINMLEVKVIEVMPKEKKTKTQQYCFQLVHPKHTLILAAESEESMKEWVATLTRAKQYWEDWNSNIEQQSSICNIESLWSSKFANEINSQGLKYYSHYYNYTCSVGDKLFDTLPKFFLKSPYSSDPNVDQLHLQLCGEFSTCKQEAADQNSVICLQRNGTFYNIGPQSSQSITAKGQGYEIKYMNGSQCPGNPGLRMSSTVSLTCGASVELVSFQNTTDCHFEIQVRSPDACQVKGLRECSLYGRDVSALSIQPLTWTDRTYYNQTSIYHISLCVENPTCYSLVGKRGISICQILGKGIVEQAFISTQQSGSNVMVLTGTNYFCPTGGSAVKGWTTIGFYTALFVLNVYIDYLM
eukprot:gene8379-9849_t